MATQEITDIFTDILDQTKGFDPVNSRKWFDDLAVRQFDGGLLEIECGDQSKADFLQDNCLDSFTRAAQQVTGYLVSVKFIVAGDARRSRNTSNAFTVKLHPDYTFDSFVVGPGNRLANASCVAVSKVLGATYNPLFIYGTVGLGKTHLLHAICNEVRKNIPQARIQYLSCEEFVNRFIGAIERGSVADFQNQYRNVDLLVIDDVQFLHEREHSQEEFFHTFNALYNNRKQIILSADCAPGEIESLQDRLASRFKWGLVARIDPPSYETRVAIVQKKAHLRGLNISDDIMEYIASMVKANIRELEGALTTIYAVSQTLGEEITLDLAKTALGSHNKLAERNTTITDIIEAVTSYFDVRLTDLQSKKRSQSITMPRQICMYLARNMTRHSLEEIGGHLGGRDHTTVMHACHKITEMEKNDDTARGHLKELTRQIKAI